MREGIAVSKPPADEDDSFNVVPFPARSVDYAGSAAALMARLAMNVNELRKTLDMRDRHNMRPRVLFVIDKIIETMGMIEHHMDVIDDCSDLLKEFIEPGGRAYFSSKGSEIPLEIISQIERRQATLMVQRFIFRAADGPMPMFEHNDDRQILLTHDGCIACQWPRAS